MAETVDFVTPADLADTLRGMAVVSLLFDPHRDHTFRLDPASGDRFGSWRDFAGNRAHLMASATGSVLLGFDHESPVSPHATATGPDDFRARPGVYDELPADLFAAVRRGPFGPDFDHREATFCLWNLGPGRVWQKGDVDLPERAYGDPDGQAYILGRLRAYIDDFCEEFQDVYGYVLDSQAAADLLSGDELSVESLSRLELDVDATAIRGELAAMGYVVVP